MGAPGGIREAVEACLKENGKITRLQISRKTGLGEDQVASSLYYLKQQGATRKELDGSWAYIPENERKPQAAKPDPVKVERAMPAPVVRVVNAAAVEPMTATEVLDRQRPEAGVATSPAVDALADVTLSAIERVLDKEIARLELELNAARDARDAYRRRAYPERGGA